MSLTFRLEGSGAGAVKAVTDLNRELDKLEKGFEGSTKSARQLEVAAGRVTRANEAPLERYNRKVRETAELVAAGKLSHDEAAKAVGRYGQQLERAGKSSEKAFGPELLARVSSLAGGFGSLAGMVAMVTKNLREMDQTAQTAADSVLNRLGAIGELQQLSGGDPAELQKMLGFARQAVREGAVKPAEAEAFAFDVFSAELNKEERDFALRLAREKIVQSSAAGGFVGAASQVRRAFGEKEAGDLPTVANKIIAAAQDIPGTDAQRFAQGLAKVAPAGKALGFSDEEVAAALVAAGQKMQFPEAVTAVGGLLNAIDAQGINEGTLAGTIEAARERVAAGESDRAVIGGNQRALAGFRSLDDPDALRATAADLVSPAPVVGPDLLLTDPRAGAAVIRERAEAREQSAVEDAFADARNRALGARGHLRAGSMERSGRGVPDLGTYLFDLAHGFNQFLGFDEGVARATMNLDRHGDIPEAERKAMLDAMQRTADGIERMEQNQRGEPARPSGRQE